MKKIGVPYVGCNPSDVTQLFGVNPNSYQFNGHSGVDFCPRNAYGKLLVAPTKVIIAGITTDYTFGDYFYPLFEKGYGIVMTDFEDNDIQYLYWHCMEVFNVVKGDIVEKGKIVAQMGNSGMCFSGGVYVPLNSRNSGKGSHLHFEKRVMGKCVDVLPDIDFTDQPRLSGLQSVQQIIQGMVNLLKNRK